MGDWDDRVRPVAEGPVGWIRDPVRVACLVTVPVLVWMPEAPFLLTLLSVVVVQAIGMEMAVRAAAPGWSGRWGRGAREGVAAAELGIDLLRFLAAGAVGAMLLARHFNGPEIPLSLGILASALCLGPDVPPLRFLWSGDPRERSRRLQTGWFFYDPAAVAVLAAGLGVCLVDRLSLSYGVLSLAVLQISAFLVFLDKHLPEVEVRRFPGWKGLLLEREGRRLAACVGALALGPLRLMAGDRAGWWGAAALAVFVAGPGGAAAIRRGLRRWWGPPASPVPSTIVVLPRR